VSIEILLGLTGIIFFGILAQWLSWQYKLPSILLLLLVGFIAGPVTGFIKPNLYFGDMLFPLVSIFVAIILFEGGLSLKFSELKVVGKVVRNIIIFGIPITWVLAIAASYFILDFSLALSFLFGAILVVTGPTVILPLLRSIRPKGEVNSILKWEGIINDPIGALLAILVFEIIITTGLTAATFVLVTSLLKIIVLSTLIGLAGGAVLVAMLRYNLIPEFLINSVTLAVVVASFTLSNVVQKESGLLAVTVMGIFMANQRIVNVTHIIEFKENLRVILISVLFIILAARLEFKSLEMLGWESIIFVLVLILVIRPASIFLSTIKDKINWKEKLFISWMAPRGIVAAAVSAIFALELNKLNIQGANLLVPITFLVIIATIAVYGLSALPLAKMLKIANPNPQGILILGAHKFAREFAKVLKDKGFAALLVDTNYMNISSARMEGLQVYYGSIISEYILKEIDLSRIGKFMAITPNSEINSLSALRFSKIFGSNSVYQVQNKEEATDEESFSSELRGKVLFGKNVTYNKLMNMMDEGYEVKFTPITKEFGYDKFMNEYNENEVLPLCKISEDGNTIVWTADMETKPKAGEKLISLVKEENGKDDQEETDE
jgi:NhaP-type Na+/H+ or K+/H+ antiporter